MLGMALVSLVATSVGIAISLAIDWFPPQASTAAEDIDHLWDVLMVASVPIFVLVMSVAIYSVVIFRAKPGDLSDGAPIHGNTKLEIIWVTIPFIMVTALAVYGWVVLDDIEAKKPNELRVNVIGQQFAWRFEYPDQKVKSTDLVLPKNRPVHFYITSDDVIHSFWVPEFRLKSDAVPGLTTKVRLTPDRLGSYQVVCAELCGLGHSTMRTPVRVVRGAEFTSWVKKQQGGGGGGGGGGAKKPDGKQVFLSNGCGSCHALADAGTSGAVGTKFDDLAAQAAKFGKSRGQSPEEYVKQSIENPRAFNVLGFPTDVMPTTFKKDLSAEEIDALVSDLLRVSGGKGK